MPQNQQIKNQTDIRQNLQQAQLPQGDENTGGSSTPADKFANIEEEVFEDDNGRHYIKIGLFEALAKYTTAGGGGSIMAGNVGDISSLAGIDTPKWNKPDVQQRAIYVARFLCTNVGFPNISAAAWVGVFVDECSCDPNKAMEKEKAGGGSAFTRGPNNYGAGIASWTGSTKKDALRSAGLPESTLVENMTLEQQCHMLQCQCTNGGYQKLAASLRRAPDFLTASARAIFATHGHHPHGWNNYDAITWADALAEEEIQARRLMNQFHRDSPYYHNFAKRRAAYGLKVLQAM